MSLILLLSSRILANVLDIAGLAIVGLLGLYLAANATGQVSEVEFRGFSIDLIAPDLFLWLLAAMVTLFVLKSGLGITLARLTSLFLARVEAEAASETAGHMFHGGLSRFREYPQVQKIWITQESAAIAFSALLFQAVSLISEASLLLSIFVFLVLVDGTTALVVALYFGLLLFVFHFSIGRGLAAIGGRLEEHYSSSSQVLIDLSTAFREIFVARATTHYLGEFASRRMGLAAARARQRYLSGLPRYVIEIGLMIGLLIIGFWQSLQGDFVEGAGVVATFLAGGTRISAALVPLQSAISEIRFNGPQAARALEVVRAARDKGSERVRVREPLLAAETSQNRQAPFVEVRGLGYSYEDGSAPALSNVSFSVKPGELVALVGPSGSGKTTLADLLLGVITPSEGNMAIDGKPPSLWHLLNLPGMSYVPQRPGVISGTIAENVALGKPVGKIDRTRIAEVLRLAHLENVISKLSEGVDTFMSPESPVLSGGEAQRLGLARALYPRPKFLILDEVTSALDAENEMLIGETIRQLRGEVTIVLIAHRLATVRTADRVLVLESGHQRAFGTFAEVRKAVPFIERYVQLSNLENTPPSMPDISSSYHQRPG